MHRPDTDFDDVFGDPDLDVDQADQTRGQVSGVDQIALEQAAQRVADAADVIEAAELAHRDAEDRLADAEGVVAVLQFKLADVETARTGPAGPAESGGQSSAERWQVAEVREQLAAAQRRYAAAGHSLSASQARLEAAEVRLTSAQEAYEHAQRASAQVDPAEAPRFASLPLFVEGFVLPNWVHHLGENYAGRWCAQWWEHAEALTRLEAVWEAFEVMRRDPAPSFSTWLRDHLDPHMRSLSDPNGVFYRCDAEKGVHEVAAPWASTPVPAGMFAVIPGALIQSLDHNDVADLTGDPTDPATTPSARTREMQRG